MRTVLGWLLILIGVTASLIGVVAAVTFGPDNKISSGSHDFSSSGAVIATSPGALTYSGPTLEVTVHTDDNQPVFLGVAHDVDVRDYLAQTSYTRLDGIDIPWDSKAAKPHEVTGDAVPQEAPGDLDWWLASQQGEGTATVTFPLPDSAVDLVAMDPDLSPDFNADLTLKLVQKGVFVGGLALAVGGVGMAVAGWVLKATAPPRPGRRRAARSHKPEKA